jgi:hypothetical protein
MICCIIAQFFSIFGIILTQSLGKDKVWCKDRILFYHLQIFPQLSSFLDEKKQADTSLGAYFSIFFLEIDQINQPAFIVLL